jgi:GTPase
MSHFDEVVPFILMISIGPLNDGRFLPVIVQSIHRNKAPCRVVRASQSASLGLNQEVLGLRNGMVLLSAESKPAGCLFFQVNTGLSSLSVLCY